MKQLILIGISVFLWTTSASAHGVRYDIESHKTVCVRIAYDDGEPMSYAEARIFSPVDAKTEHQNGRTDRNGRLAFAPDTAGNWTVAVNDGMGHAIRAMIHFNADDDSATVTGPRPDSPGFVSVLCGLSAIFLVFGAFFWWKGLRLARKKQEQQGPAA